MTSTYRCFHCETVVPAGQNHNCTRWTQEAPVEVTQADIDAAAEYNRPASYSLAQAFARHRIASTSPVQADAVSVEGPMPTLATRSREVEAQLQAHRVPGEPDLSSMEYSRVAKPDPLSTTAADIIAQQRAEIEGLKANTP